MPKINTKNRSAHSPAAKPELTSGDRRSAEKRDLNVWLAGDYSFLITLTAADGNLRDIDFVRCASGVLIYMNEELFGKSYGARGNGNCLRGFAFLERQEKRVVVRPSGRVQPPLHVHLLIQPLALKHVSPGDELGIVEDSLRTAAAKLMRPVFQLRLTLSQAEAFRRAAARHGRYSPEVKSLTRRHTHRPVFSQKGIDIRPVDRSQPLIAYLMKELNGFDVGVTKFDFVVPIEPNGLSLAQYF